MLLVVFGVRLDLSLMGIGIGFATMKRVGRKVGLLGSHLDGDGDYGTSTMMVDVCTLLSCDP
jgi:hypothetical protein